MRKLTICLLVSVCLLLFSVPLLPAPASRSQAVTRNAAAPAPNIILILTDDLDALTVKFMPKLKSLVIDEGMSFTNFFVNVSLCCPSRASILRAQYAHNHKILSNSPPTGGFALFRDLQRESSTIATWLQSAGYHTVLIGKYMNGYQNGDPQYIPAGWSEWYARVDKERLPSEDGPSSYYNYRVNENGRLVSYGNRPEDYLTDVQARTARAFIARAAARDRPFFMFLSVNAPHKPEVPAPRHLNALPELAFVPRTEAFNERDTNDKPSLVRKLPLLNAQQIEKLDRIYRKRAQMMLAVDDLVEGVVRQLEASGQLENTYIFFTSDNGYHLGQHRLKPGKSTFYEDDIRVPMFVRGPAIAPGRVVSELAGNIDLGPTFAELAGANAPVFVDGRSLVPFLTGDKNAPANWRQVFLLERFEPTNARSAGLRAKDFKYVEYTNGEREFYNLKSDPQELNNIFTSADSALINELAARLQLMNNCQGKNCRDVEEQPLSNR